jgi:hypothetical protein
LRRNAAVRSEQNRPHSGCETGIHRSGNSASLLVRACIAPPEAP